MFRFIWMLSIHAHDFFQHYMPSNRLLANTRTRRGLKRGVSAMLVGVTHLAVANVCTILIDRGAPEWLHLVVLWGIWYAFKFVINGPVSLFLLVRAVMREQMTNQTGWVRVPINSGC